MPGMTIRRSAPARLVLLAVLLTVPSATLLAPARAASPAEDETLRYRWRLDGFLGALAGIFVPNDGDGELTVRHQPGGRLRSELTITAPERSDFFRYGAEWEPSTGTTVSAWSSQLWRGEPKSKQAEIGQTGVIDVATAVHALRRAPPSAPRRLEIWSDGKLYPVMVYPRGAEQRRIGGKTIACRHFAIRSINVPGRRAWKGELDLWLADDSFATPVEILVARSSARVRLELVERRVGPATEPVNGGSP